MADTIKVPIIGSNGRLPDEYTPQGALDAQAAAESAAGSIQRGVPGGVASLDSAGRVPLDQVAAMDAAAIQAALDTDGVAHVGPGVIEVDTPIVLPAGGVLRGSGRHVTVLRAAVGSSMDAVIVNTISGTDLDDGTTIADLTVDGNKDAGVTLGTAGIYIAQRNDVVVRDVTICNVDALDGLRLLGVPPTASASDPRPRGCMVQNVIAHDCTQRGLHVGNGMRDAVWDNIYAYRNGTVGVMFDTSQTTADNIVAFDNAQQGIFINNTFDCAYTNLRGIQNGTYGIYALGLVDCIGDTWQASANFTDPNATDEVRAEIYFTADTASYGLTRRSTIDGIMTRTIWGNVRAGTLHADYGLYVADGITEAVRLANVDTWNSGVIAPNRFPAELGTLDVTAPDGRRLTGVPHPVNLFAGDPSFEDGAGAGWWVMVNCTLAIETGDAYRGSQCLEVTGDSTNTANAIYLKPSQRVSVTPGEIYSVGAYVKNVSGGIDHFDLRLQWYDSSNAMISDQVVHEWAYVEGAWKFVCDTGVAPAGAAAVGMLITGKPDGPGRVWLVDCVQITEGSPTIPYGDGDQPGWKWDGTPHASTSRRITTLTDADTATVDSTYGADEAGVITNLRQRLGEIESVLQRLGHLN